MLEDLGLRFWCMCVASNGELLSEMLRHCAQIVSSHVQGQTTSVMDAEFDDAIEATCAPGMEVRGNAM